MKANIIDRAIATVSPGKALQRLEARARLEVLGQLPSMSALDQGNAQDPRNAPGGSGGGLWRRFTRTIRDARADTVANLRLDRGASRHLARTVPIAVGAINTNVDRVIGTGLALSPQPNLGVLGWDAARGLEWVRHVQNEFSMWADSSESDQAGELNFYQQQALVLRSTLESGDCFTLMPDGERTATMPYALRLQVLEADRVGNPGTSLVDTATMSQGVRLDAQGRPEAYHLYDQHPGSYLLGSKGPLLVGDWVERIGPSGRRRMLHHYRKLRPGQPRGLPYLSPIIDAIQQIARYTEAEIMAAVITAYFTVFVETPAVDAPPVHGTQEGFAPGTTGLGMGAVVDLAPGEKVTTANPGRPNPNFGPFIDAVITQMGMALSLPRELLIKQFNASYSASKAALLDAWVYFRSVRVWTSLSFCQPAYETFMAEAVAIGRIKAPGFFADPLLRWAYTRAVWPGDSMGSIDPQKEVKAYTDAIDARLMTRARAEWELFGSDFNETLDVKQSEQQRLKAADLLPVPKAGAAAAPTSAGEPGATKETE